jgi:selenocysteine lyase/cysteine desulfurase
MPVSFRELDCDYFVTSLHKWLGAPVGNGMLVVKEELIDRTWPLLAPFDPPPLGVDKFDHWNLGTYNSALQAGISPAVRFHSQIGTGSIHARLQHLARYWVDRAREIPGFRLHTPLDTEELGAVSLFSVDGLDYRTIEHELRATHQVHVKYRHVGHLDGMRVSPHIYTQEEDLDRFVEALERVVRAVA